MAQFKEQTLLSAVVATTTSAVFNVENYSNVGLQFLAAAITSGNGVFTVAGTIDGTNWVTLSNLIDNATGMTRIASKTLNANGSALVWLDMIPGLKAIRVTVTRTTDGTYSCFALASE